MRWITNLKRAIDKIISYEGPFDTKSFAEKIHQNTLDSYKKIDHKREALLAEDEKLRPKDPVIIHSGPCGGFYEACDNCYRGFSKKD